jgi:hypothetical protein
LLLSLDGWHRNSFVKNPRNADNKPAGGGNTAKNQKADSMVAGSGSHPGARRAGEKSRCLSCAHTQQPAAGLSIPGIDGRLPAPVA